jgi:hypothetical protein
MMTKNGFVWRVDCKNSEIKISIFYEHRVLQLSIFEITPLLITTAIKEIKESNNKAVTDAKSLYAL